MTSDTHSREKLWSLIKGTKFGLFTTRHANGHLHSRPMTTQNKKIDEDDRLWFFMSRSGDSVSDLLADPQVNIGYANPGDDSYVSVSGVASISSDEAKKRELWSKLNEAYFKGGMDDPDAALVEVRISHAHYWDVDDSKIVQLYKMAKAAVTGETPKLGKNAEVRMN